MIRKISVGSDYKSAMHYIVGQTVLRDYVIDCIHFNKENISYCIYIKKGDEIVIWKEFNNSYPVAIEYDLNY